MMGHGNLFYMAENGVTTALMTPESITYYDEKGRTRTQLGAVEFVLPSTGAETRFPAAVVLFDADNNVIWQAP